jgi:Lamin Tail Domain
MGIVVFGAGSASAISTSLVINEVDYDQPSTDTEFLELKNVSGSAIDLDAYSVELVNGTGGGAAAYLTIALPATSLAAGDYFVVCANPTTTASCDLDGGADSNLIQNGDPDAIGLRQGTTLIDAVSYGGNSGAPYTEGSGMGLDDDPLSATDGLSRCPDGIDTDGRTTRTSSSRRSRPEQPTTARLHPARSSSTRSTTTSPAPTRRSSSS